MTFSVAVQGTAPFSYQWRKNGAAISNATNPAYSIGSVTTADAASYSVAVTNPYGSTISDNAVLTVSSAVVAPSITSQPSSLTVTAGQSASFSVAASGSSLAYQWRKNGTTIAGATSTTYSIAATSSADAASYSVVVSNSAGSVTSNAATLTVNTTSTAGELAPQSYSARGDYAPAEGIAQLFDGQASSKWLDFSASTWVQIALPAPASLQSYSLTSANDASERDPASWTLSGSNDGVTWTTIETRSGQSWSSRFLNRSFTLSAPSASYSRFRFSFQATSGAITQLAELKLFGTSGGAVPPPVTAPSITTQPTSLTVTVGQAASFSVAASGSGLTYQWRKNGAALSGATSATCSIASTTSADAASYSVVVSNSAGSVTSANATLTVTTTPTATALTPQSFSARGQFAPAEGIAQLFDGQNSTKWLDFSASSWVQVNLASAASLLNYSLTSANDASERDPASWTLAGSNDGVTWTTIETRSGQSWSSRFQTRNFVLAAPSVSYSRFRFSFQATSGAITQLAELKLFGTSGGAAPPPVTAPSITTQPASLTVTAGQSASFSVAASGSGLAYQWRKNGTTLSGATSATYSIAATSSADAASYSVVVSNAAGSVTSASAALTVNTTPSTIVELTPQSFSARGDFAPVEGIAQLFDGQTSTKWLDFSASSWVKIVLPSPKVLQAYSLTSANDAPERDPASWTLSGSNDGVTWTAIETRNGQSWNNRFLTRDFVLATPSAAYSQYRFDFQAASSAITQLAELELFGSATASPSIVELTPQSFSALGDFAPVEGIAQLFDGQTSTKWLHHSATTWVQITLSSGRVLQAYSLTSANDAPERDPASWTLSGSNDGATWTVIETRSGQSWNSRFLTRDFVLATPSAAYRHFRFNFQATSGSIVQLAELELFGSP